MFNITSSNNTIKKYLKSVIIKSLNHLKINSNLRIQKFLFSTAGKISVNMLKCALYIKQLQNPYLPFLF